MPMLDQIGQEKRRIAEQLTRLDTEREKLSVRLNELEIAQRAVGRLGDKGIAPKKQRRARAPTATPAIRAERGEQAQAGQQVQIISLGDATLKAVRAHAKGVSSDALLKYLSRRFGMTVRLNHLSSALNRHERAGRLENRNQRWYLLLGKIG
jgi:hypothetical protein